MKNIWVKNKKIIMIGILVIIGLVAIGKHTFEKVVSSDFAVSRMIENGKHQKAEVAKDLLDPDNISVILVGTAGPMNPELAQNSTAVFINGQFLLFDAGDYAQKKMEQLNLPMASLDAVFLTHFHNDHIADLGEVMQRSFILGREKDMVVHGPTGVNDIVKGFNMVYALDSDHRTEHHGEETMPSKYHFATASEFDSELESAIVYEKEGVVVTAFKNYHPPIEPTFAYVVEYLGKKIVITGDTLITDELAEYSESADLLVTDIMNYELVTLMEETYADLGDDQVATIMFDIREYHPDVKDVAKMAQNQKVKVLALTHYAPAAPTKQTMNRFYIDPIKKIYEGEVIAGSDGTRIVIPVKE